MIHLQSRCFNAIRVRMMREKRCDSVTFISLREIWTHPPARQDWRLLRFAYPLVRFSFCASKFADLDQFKIDHDERKQRIVKVDNGFRDRIIRLPVPWVVSTCLTLGRG
jgi:hypothetical protein